MGDLHSSLRVKNDEEDDDTGLGEFRDGGTAFNSFVTKTATGLIFFFQRKNMELFGQFFFFQVCDYRVILFLYRGKKLI